MNTPLGSLLFAVVVVIVAGGTTVLFMYRVDAVAAGLWGVCCGAWLSVTATRLAAWQQYREQLRISNERFWENSDGAPD